MGLGMLPPAPRESGLITGDFHLPDRFTATYWRIPADVRPALSAVDLLARCLEFERLTELGAQIGGLTGHFHCWQAEKILAARPESVLLAEANVLATRAESTTDMRKRRALQARLGALIQANPRPILETLTQARAAVAAELQAHGRVVAAHG